MAEEQKSSSYCDTSSAMLSASDKHHFQSQVQLASKLTPVQTPSNLILKTGGQQSVSMSQATDTAENYDSVHSLSQAALDDSLNFKKEQTRLLQAQASLLREEKDHEDFMSEDEILDDDQVEESEIAAETDEDKDDGTDDRMSALQKMLQASELFITKQTTSGQKQPQSQPAHYPTDYSLDNASSDVQDCNEGNQDNYSRSHEKGSDSGRLPGVHAQEDSTSSRQDFSDYNGVDDDGDFNGEIVRQSSSAFEESVEPTSSDRLSRAHHQEATSIGQEDEYVQKSSQNSLREALSGLEIDGMASNMQYDDVGDREADFLADVEISPQHRGMPQTKVHSQKELETVENDLIKDGEDRSVSDLTVVRNPSFLTVIRAKTSSFQDQKSPIPHISTTKEDHLIQLSAQSDSLNNTSVDHQQHQLHNNGQHIKLNNSQHMHDNDFNSSISSSYATPVVGAQLRQDQTVSPEHGSNRNTLSKASPESSQPYRSYRQNPNQLSRGGKTPSLTSYKQSVDEGTIYQNEDGLESMHAFDGVVGGSEEISMLMNEGEGPEEEEALMSELQLGYNRRTVRQSIDVQSPSVIPTGANQPDSIEFFQTGPREIVSSDDGSSGSSNPLQVSAASVSAPGCLQSSFADTHNNSALQADPVTDPNIIETSLSPVLSSDDIKVLHFTNNAQMDSLATLDGLDKIDSDSRDENRLSLKMQMGSMSEPQGTGAHSTPLSGLPQQSHANSLTNSLKKASSSQHTNSDLRTRSFSDVLNAMRDTVDIEKERQLSQTPESSPAKMTVLDDDRELANQDTVGFTIKPHQVDQESAASELETGKPELDAYHGVEVDVTLGQNMRQAQTPVIKTRPNKFEEVRRTTMGSMPAHQIEIYSDSLNTKSEEKKYHTNSNDEERHSSPSFYKIDTEENEVVVGNDVRADYRDEYHRQEYINAASFASGAQAQIAYTDQLHPPADQAQKNHHHRVTSGPTKQASSSHYRGESFGNCLLLTSVATSSQRDSLSQEQLSDSPAKRNSHSPMPINLAMVKGSLELGEHIREQVADEEESNEGAGAQSLRQKNVIGTSATPNESSDSGFVDQLDRVMLIEDDTGNDEDKMLTDEMADSYSVHLLQNTGESRDGGEESATSEQRQLTKSLSKTDSLQDLKAFFSRDQLRCRTDGDQLLSEDNEKQFELGGTQSQIEMKHLQISIQQHTDAIAEENVEESSPERVVPSNKPTLENSKQSTNSRRTESAKLEIVPQFSARQQKGRETQRAGKGKTLDEDAGEAMVHKAAAVKNVDMMSWSIANDSEIVAGNGPPQSINASDYSLLKNLVDKALISPPDQNSSQEDSKDTSQTFNKLRHQNRQLQDYNLNLQAKLRQAEQRANDLETQKNKATARVEMLQSQNLIASEQLSNQQQNAEHFENKYRLLRDEFRKMKVKYQCELTQCVDEMENLRFIVIDVVSQQSEQKLTTKRNLSSTLKMSTKGRDQGEVLTPVQHIVQSSTGEPALLPDNDLHSQSEKVLGLRNSLHKKSNKIGNAKQREETTSSESPARFSRTGAIAPLVKPQQLKRSGRFSSHEQFSITSSQNQTARFSTDFTNINAQKPFTISEYGDDAKGSQRNRKAPFDTNSNSSFKQTQGTSNPGRLLLKVINDNESRSTSTSRWNKTHKTTTHISERESENYASVLNSNRRTIDIMKQTINSGGTFQQVKRQEKLKQTQNLQKMLSNLYQQSTPSATSTTTPKHPIQQVVTQDQQIDLAQRPTVASLKDSMSLLQSKNKKSLLMTRKRR